MQILCTKRLSYNPDTYIETENEPYTLLQAAEHQIMSAQ